MNGRVLLPALFCLLAWLGSAPFQFRAIGAQAAPPGLEVARVFTDNAVLQRDEPCVVYGEDLPGTSITVTVAGQRLPTVAGPDRHWRVKLAPMAATAGPLTLTIEGSSRQVLTNLAVGDVWLITGQSNADFPLASAAGGRAAAARATNALIRLLLLAEAPRTDARSWTAAEVARLNPRDYFRGAWEVNSPAHAGAISAVGYFFASMLQTNLNVPIGLIDCSVGGTMAENWMPPEAISGNPRLKAIADNFLGSERVPAFAKSRLLQNLADWDKAGRPAPMPEHPYKPGACWRLGLSALAPFTLKGVLWYQGETDADFSAPADYEPMARDYVEAFSALAAGWRSAWERPELPVYFVQLPQMNRPSWPWFRESQWRCSQVVSNTAMAVAFDCGEPNNVHPANKQPVGERLALIARALSYGQPVEWSGPTCRRHRVEGGQVVLEFDHVGGGLVSKDGQPLRLFEVAGADGNFFPATAGISGSTVIVSAPQVPHPVAVRYAWVPVGKMNFYNRAGLPAAPFRTGP